MSALETQIDGQHYKQMILQPIELAYLIGATPCFTKLAKYGSRIKGERREQDLKKAVHCIQLEEDMMKSMGRMIITAYPNRSYDDKIEMAYKWIDIFVAGCSINDEHNYFKNALKLMYLGNYSMAIGNVKNILSKEGYGL